MNESQCVSGRLEIGGSLPYGELPCLIGRLMSIGVARRGGAAYRSGDELQREIVRIAVDGGNLHLAVAKTTSSGSLHSLTGLLAAFRMPYRFELSDHDGGSHWRRIPGPDWVPRDFLLPGNRPHGEVHLPLSTVTAMLDDPGEALRILRLADSPPVPLLQIRDLPPRPFGSVAELRQELVALLDRVPDTLPGREGLLQVLGDL